MGSAQPNETPTPASETVAFGAVGTPVGRLLVTVTEAGLAAVDFRDSPSARRRAEAATGLPVVADPGRIASVCAELAAYFGGELTEFTVPIDWRLVSSLQRRVLATLHTTVPYGRVLTYGELGARSGSGVPARAIGQIMGSNPIPIVVPCHRVVAGTGLGGYSGGFGVEIKRWLLTLEGALPATFDWDQERGPMP
jgi:methylated-DNA-[protein]-cysteine S-methyltransferase